MYHKVMVLQKEATAAQRLMTLGSSAPLRKTTYWYVMRKDGVSLITTAVNTIYTYQVRAKEIVIVLSPDNAVVDPV